MTNYRINKAFYTYYPDTIELGLSNLDMLSDNEQIQFISDCLLHEHIHVTLYKLFNRPTSALFDAIEQHFIDRTIEQKYIDNASDSYSTWKTFINNYGFDCFLDWKCLTQYDINKARNICNHGRMI